MPKKAAQPKKVRQKKAGTAMNKPMGKTEKQSKRKTNALPVPSRPLPRVGKTPIQPTAGKASARKKTPAAPQDHFQGKLASHAGEKGSLIPLLQAAQVTYGYIPEHAIIRIHEAVGVPVAEIYGVITFYSQFRLKPLGKYLIKMCDGTACHVNGSERLAGAIEDELHLGGNDTTEEGLFTLQKVACLGCCSLSPVIMINDETYGRLTPKKVQLLLKEYKSRAQKPQTA